MNVLLFYSLLKTEHNVFTLLMRGNGIFYFIPNIMFDLSILKRKKKKKKKKKVTK